MKTLLLPKYLDSPTDFFNGWGKEPESALPYYERIGFAEFRPFDEYFVSAPLPDGWTYEECGYWTYVYDNKGLQRFSFFKKMASWDTDGFTRCNTRYSVRRDYSVMTRDWEADRKVKYYVKDADNSPSGDDATRLYKCRLKTIKNGARNYDPESEEAHAERIKCINAEEAAESKQVKECEKWLDEHFPDWKDIYAYWD